MRNSLASIETHRSTSQITDTESITVNVILKDKHLTVCNIYSPPSKAIQLPQPSQDQEHWLAIGDFNSHSPSWGYKNMDPKGEELEGWIIANNLVLINKPDNQPTFYSRVWHSTSSPDLAVATDDIQKITSREVCQQLGGSDHRPVILTLQKQIIREGKLPPSWNYKKADWDLYKKQTDTSTADIQVSGWSVDKAAKEFTSAIQCSTQEHPKRQTKGL